MFIIKQSADGRSLEPLRVCPVGKAGGKVACQGTPSVMKTLLIWLSSAQDSWFPNRDVVLALPSLEPALWPVPASISPATVSLDLA